MFAKVVGAVTALAVFFLYFRLRGTDPVLETVVGILISLGAGFWAYLATGRRLSRQRAEERRDREPAGRASPEPPPGPRPTADD